MIQVAIAIIFNTNKQILITKRGYNSQHSEKWELPGGKITPLETPEQALYREIKEELGIDVIKCDFFTKLRYQYPDKGVELFIYKINEYVGIPECLENQLELKWVYAEDLTKYDLLEANYQIIDLIESC